LLTEMLTHEEKKTHIKYNIDKQVTHIHLDRVQLPSLGLSL